MKYYDFYISGDNATLETARLCANGAIDFQAEQYSQPHPAFHDRLEVVEVVNGIVILQHPNDFQDAYYFADNCTNTNI